MRLYRLTVNQTGVTNPCCLTVHYESPGGEFKHQLNIDVSLIVRSSSQTMSRQVWALGGQDPKIQVGALVLLLDIKWGTEIWVHDGKNRTSNAVTEGA
jgi:hypothetical protein